MNTRNSALVGIYAFTLFGTQILGLIIHVMTIIVAYNGSGLFAACISMVTPVLSEIYWFFKVWANAGLGNYYCLAILAFLGLSATFIVVKFLIYLEIQRERDQQ